jgi:hypothetical protein
VGERRDQLSYPSTYCPNLVQATTESTETANSRSVLFVTEAPVIEHDHEHGP